jgi:hypothetical protein
MRKTLMAAVTAAAALAPAGAAGAADQARFVAYVEGKQVTTWDIPRHDTYFNCQGQRWEEGGGREVVRFQIKPTRILVYRNRTGSSLQMKIGTWSLFKQRPRFSITGSGKLERTGRIVRGIDPSVCHDADDPTVEDTGPYDCGSRTLAPDVSIGWVGDRVHVDATDLLGPVGATFENCPVMGPVEPTEGGYTKIGERYPVRDVFDRSQGLVEVLGRKTWTEKIAAGHGTATTTTTFKLRLRRAK